MDFTAGEKLTASKMNNTLQARCHAYQIVTQSLSNAIAAPITFTAEAYDPLGFHSTSVNTSRITPTVAGRYKVYGQVTFAANITGDRAAQVNKNGSGIDGLAYGAQGSMKGTGLVFGIASCSGTVDMNGSTDYLELTGTQNSGGALSTAYLSGFSASYLIVERIGD